MAAAIAESLLHFIWQGTVLGALAYLMFRRVGDLPRARYAVGLGTLVAMALAPVVTSLWLLSDGVATIISVPGSVAVVAGNTLPVAWVLSLWASGVAVCAIRLAGGWMLARGIATRAAAPVSREVAAMASRIAARLSVSTPFTVLESAVAATPLMIGWLKPVILLPSAAIAGLPPSQLEALLAHELSHIRRHDYIINLLQSAVESLLFFHPAVWLVSREVREAREQCCDDVTVSVCDRLVYVSALSSVASLRAASPALAAGGGSLRNRVQRILHPKPTAPSALAWLAVAPIVLVLVAAMPVTGTPETVAAPRVAAPQAHVDGPWSAGASAPASSQGLKPSRSMTTPTVSRASSELPRSVPVQMSASRPALPVVLNYFTVPAQAMELQAPPPQPIQERRVAAGDILRLLWTNVVNADDDLNQRYVVDVNGNITLKYVGFVLVAGKTKTEIERTVVDRFTDAQLYPRGVISVAVAIVADDRGTIIIHGQVGRPGEKRFFADDMTLLKVIAAAGGLLPASGDVEIRRVGVGQAINITKAQLQAGADLKLIDGDMVTVRQDYVFFITGQVMNPGQKAWTEAMTVQKAAALAGGTTPQGKFSHIERPVKDERGRIIKYTKIKNLKPDTKVLPDDTLVVARKWIGE
jgi:protein involved in polysaccharide export with SLBB domain/beta-lactamase regulating signal transducer with metallopeptidase domain